jgi:hypothetical protein
MFMKRRIVALLCSMGVAAALATAAIAPASAGAIARAPSRATHVMPRAPMLAQVSARMLLRGSGPTLAAPDVAASDNLCADFGSGLCLNDSQCTVHAGNPILSWYGNSSCEDFITQPINPCNSTPADQVTPTCPFTVGSGYNNTYDHDEIYAIDYAGGDCVGTNSGGFAILNTCPNPAGNGGADGTIMIFASNGDLVNRYWTNYIYGLYGTKGNPSVMCSQGANGDQITLSTGPNGSYCQWSYPRS